MEILDNDELILFLCSCMLMRDFFSFFFFFSYGGCVAKGVGFIITGGELRRCNEARSLVGPGAKGLLFGSASICNCQIVFVECLFKTLDYESG